MTTHTAAHIRSWIEVISDGTSGGSHVFLVVSAGDKQEFRYKIPGVMSARWTCFAGAKARLQLVLAGTSVRSQVEIKSETTQLETILTEIAAARLSSDDVGNDDGATRFVDIAQPVTAFHAAWCALRCCPEHACDCGSGT